jgi:putative transposase
MYNDKLVSLKTPETCESFTDALSELVRQGAQQIIAQAVETELKEFLLDYQDLKDDQGRQAAVRNGYLPQRTVMTGIGSVEIQVPKVRDRSERGIKFNSRLLPPYLKRSQSVEELLPWLYLKGVSTGDFSKALTSLLGAQAPGLSANTISRLKVKWMDKHQQWQQRSIAQERYIVGRWSVLQSLRRRRSPMHSDHSWSHRDRGQRTGGIGSWISWGYVQKWCMRKHQATF